MNKHDTRSIVEGALLSAITIILSLTALYIPFIGIFASLIWPVPIIILGIRHGLKTSIMATVVSGIIVSMIEGPVQGFSIVLGFGLIGIAMGWAINRDFSPFKVLACGATASLVAKVLLLLISLSVMGINPLTEEIKAMRESIPLIENMYKGFGLSPDKLKLVVENLSNMIDIMAIAIPAILVMASLMDAFLSYKFTKLILSKMGHKLKDFTPFWMWRFPAYTVFLYLIGVLMAMLDQYVKIGIFKIIGINLRLVFSFIFLIQGFSMMTYFMGKYNVSKILRVVIVFLVFFNPIFLQLASWAGMLDILFNFRHL